MKWLIIYNLLLNYIKLSKLPINKLKSGIKHSTEVTLNFSSNVIRDPKIQ